MEEALFGVMYFQQETAPNVTSVVDTGPGTAH